MNEKTLWLTYVKQTTGFSGWDNCDWVDDIDDEDDCDGYAHPMTEPA